MKYSKLKKFFRGGVAAHEHLSLHEEAPHEHISAEHAESFKGTKKKTSAAADKERVEVTEVAPKEKVKGSKTAEEHVQEREVGAKQEARLSSKKAQAKESVHQEIGEKMQSPAFKDKLEKVTGKKATEFGSEPPPEKLKKEVQDKINKEKASADEKAKAKAKADADALSASHNKVIAGDKAHLDEKLNKFSDDFHSAKDKAYHDTPVEEHAKEGKAEGEADVTEAREKAKKEGEGAESKKEGKAESNAKEASDEPPPQEPHEKDEPPKDEHGSENKAEHESDNVEEHEKEQQGEEEKNKSAEEDKGSKDKDADNEPVEEPHEKDEEHGEEEKAEHESDKAEEKEKEQQGEEEKDKSAEEDKGSKDKDADNEPVEEPHEKDEEHGEEEKAEHESDKAEEKEKEHEGEEEKEKGDEEEKNREDKDADNEHEEEPHEEDKERDEEDKAEHESDKAEEKEKEHEGEEEKEKGDEEEKDREGKDADHEHEEEPHEKDEEHGEEDKAEREADKTEEKEKEHEGEEESFFKKVLGKLFDLLMLILSFVLMFLPVIVANLPELVLPTPCVGSDCSSSNKCPGGPNCGCVGIDCNQFNPIDITPVIVAPTPVTPKVPGVNLPPGAAQAPAPAPAAIQPPTGWVIFELKNQPTSDINIQLSTPDVLTFASNNILFPYASWNTPVIINFTTILNPSADGLFSELNLTNRSDKYTVLKKSDSQLKKERKVKKAKKVKAPSLDAYAPTRDEIEKEEQILTHLLSHDTTIEESLKIIDAAVKKEESIGGAEPIYDDEFYKTVDTFDSVDPMYEYNPYEILVDPSINELLIEEKDIPIEEEVIPTYENGYEEYMEEVIGGQEDTSESNDSNESNESNDSDDPTDSSDAAEALNSSNNSSTSKSPQEIISDIDFDTLSNEIDEEYLDDDHKAIITFTLMQNITTKLTMSITVVSFANSANPISSMSSIKTVSTTTPTTTPKIASMGSLASLGARFGGQVNSTNANATLANNSTNANATLANNSSENNSSENNSSNPNISKNITWTIQPSSITFTDPTMYAYFFSQNIYNSLITLHVQERLDEKTGEFDASLDTWKKQRLASIEKKQKQFIQDEQDVYNTSYQESMQESQDKIDAGNDVLNELDKVSGGYYLKKFKRNTRKSKR